MAAGLGVVLGCQLLVAEWRIGGAVRGDVRLWGYADPRLWGHGAMGLQGRGVIGPWGHEAMGLRGWGGCRGVGT